MDMQVYPNGIWDPKDPTKFSAEAVTATINLPALGISKDATGFSLEPDGSVGRAMPAEGGVLKLDPKDEALWYLIKP